MKCEKCGGHAVSKNVVKKFATSTGILVGGLSALKGMKTGAQIGTALVPGPGTVIGGILGFLTGAAAGGIAGSSVGKLIDESIVRQYECEDCGNIWRVS